MPDSFAAALAALQADLPRIPRTATGQAGNRRYKYPPYDAILRRVRPKLKEHGFMWHGLPTLTGSPERFVLLYALTHIESGERITGQYPLQEGAAQQQGAQISYAKRYALVAVLDLEVVGEDDDAMPREHIKIPGPDHERLQPRAQPGDRAAERFRGPVDNDPVDMWTEPVEKEHQVGSILPKQRSNIMRHLGRLSSDERVSRLQEITQDFAITSTNDLSMTQAGVVIAELEAQK